MIDYKIVKEGDLYKIYIPELIGKSIPNWYHDDIYLEYDNFNCSVIIKKNQNLVEFFYIDDYNEEFTSEEQEYVWSGNPHDIPDEIFQVIIEDIFYCF